jgi:hypothetical protein
MLTACANTMMLMILRTDVGVSVHAKVHCTLQRALQRAAVSVRNAAQYGQTWHDVANCRTARLHRLPTATSLINNELPSPSFPPQWTTRAGTHSAEHKRSVAHLLFASAYPNAPQENEAYNREYRRSGIHQPVEDVGPMDEAFIGGFRNHQPPSPRPPAPPPKDYPYTAPHDHRPPAHAAAPSEFPNAAYPPQIQPASRAQLAHMSAIERSQALRVPRMQPHLQVRSPRRLSYAFRG